MNSCVAFGCPALQPLQPLLKDTAHRFQRKLMNGVGWLGYCLVDHAARAARRQPRLHNVAHWKQMRDAVGPSVQMVPPH
jgi:hypothetical protein